MENSLREKATELTRFIFKLPTAPSTILYLLVFGFLAGFVLHYAFAAAESFPNAFFNGGFEGIVILSLPAVLAAVLATGGLERKHFRWGFKYFVFIAFASAAITALGYGGALAGAQLFGTQFLIPALVTNALLVVIWFISAFVALGYNAWRALPVSFVHPLLNIASLVFWRAYGVVGTGNPLYLVAQLLVAATILLVALWALFYVINAPAKRNFGINAVQAASLFFAQWINGSKGLEDVLAEMGEIAEVLVSAIAFKTRAGKTKALFLVPHLHYGPVGNVGGSQWPALLAEHFQQKINAPALVFKGTAGHDFNPVHSTAVKQVAAGLEACLREAEPWTTQAAILRGKAGACNAFGLSFNKRAFLTLSRAPDHTDDIDAGLGIALRNALLAKGFEDCTIIDRHNSSIEAQPMAAGSIEFFESLDAITNSKHETRGLLKLGVATDALHSIGAIHGVAKAGLKVAVLECGGKRACFILIDSNNCTTQFREHALRRLKRFDFAFEDVFTTDTHALNGISGVHNPIGQRPGFEPVLETIDRTVAEALKNLEPVSAAMATRRVRVEVLGGRRSSELLSTVGAIVSVAKILAIPVFIAALGLALLSLITIF